MIKIVYSFKLYTEFIDTFLLIQQYFGVEIDLSGIINFVTIL
jgi:hypothetical protein